MTLTEPIAILAALAALVAIPYWVKVATAGAPDLQARALSKAAIPTVIMLGLFVIAAGASMMAQALS